MKVIIIIILSSHVFILCLSGVCYVYMKDFEKVIHKRLSFYTMRVLIIKFPTLNTFK